MDLTRFALSAGTLLLTPAVSTVVPPSPLFHPRSSGRGLQLTSEVPRGVRRGRGVIFAPTSVSQVTPCQTVWRVNKPLWRWATSTFTLGSDKIWTLSAGTLLLTPAVSTVVPPSPLLHPRSSGVLQLAREVLGWRWRATTLGRSVDFRRFESVNGVPASFRRQFSIPARSLPNGVACG